MLSNVKPKSLLLFCRIADKMVLSPTNWFGREQRIFVTAGAFYGRLTRRSGENRRQEPGNQEHKNVNSVSGSFYFITKMFYLPRAVECLIQK